MNADVEFHIRHNYPWSKVPGNVRQVRKWCSGRHQQPMAVTVDLLLSCRVDSKWNSTNSGSTRLLWLNTNRSSSAVPAVGRLQLSVASVWFLAWPGSPPGIGWSSLSLFSVSLGGWVCSQFPKLPLPPPYQCNYNLAGKCNTLQGEGPLGSHSPVPPTLAALSCAGVDLARQ